MGSENFYSKLSKSLPKTPPGSESQIEAYDVQPGGHQNYIVDGEVITSETEANQAIGLLAAGGSLIRKFTEIGIKPEDVLIIWPGGETEPNTFAHFGVSPDRLDMLRRVAGVVAQKHTK
jgi:hypothetical protein